MSERVLGLNGKILVNHSTKKAYKYAGNSGTINITENGLVSVNGCDKANVAIQTGAPAWLVVTTAVGSTVTITNATSGETHTGVATSITISFNIYSIGIWNVTVSKDGLTVTGSVNVTNQTGIALYSAPAWVVACKNGSVGDIVNHSGYDWVIVHKTTTAATLGLKTWYTDTIFGANTIYKDSTIANLCATFENGLTIETKQWLNSVTVPHDKTPYDDYDVTAKVWIPNRDQVGGSSGTGTLSYYNSNDRRKFNLSDATVKYWWTSSTNSSSYVWRVHPNGDISYGNQSGSLGFRPHMEVNIDF